MKNKQYWSMTEGAFNCLLDQQRTRAFVRAIKQAVRPGDVVADIGAGTGVLSMVAAKAGAGKVYAVEADARNVQTLQSTFSSNGLGQIEILHADATKCKFPQKVDVIICEMVATALIEELQVPAMNNALPYLKKGGRVVLRRMRNYVELVSSRDRFHGFFFPIFRYEYSDFPELRSTSLVEKRLYATIDFAHKVHDTSIKFNKRFKVKREGYANAIRISSETEFWDGTRFNHSFAYSFPVILPVEPVFVKRGDFVNLNLSYKLCGGVELLRWGVKLL